MLTFIFDLRDLKLVKNAVCGQCLHVIWYNLQNNTYLWKN